MTGPPDETPWRQAAYAAIDLETTGLDPRRDEIISFAVVPLDSGRVRPAGLLYELVRPERMPPPETIRIHGLRRAELEGAPVLDELLPALRRAVSGRVLIAHVAAVERRFLGAAFSSRGLEAPEVALDTAALAARLDALRGRRARAGRRPVGLSVLARSLGLPVHRPHHADGDALTTAQVFIALAAKLEAVEPEPLTVGSLREMGAPLAERRGTGLTRRLLSLARLRTRRR